MIFIFSPNKHCVSVSEKIDGKVLTEVIGTFIDKNFGYKFSLHHFLTSKLGHVLLVLVASLCPTIWAFGYFFPF